MQNIIPGSYIYEGDVTSLLSYFKKLGEYSFSIQTFGTFGIEDARTLKINSSEKESSQNNVYILSVSTIQSEAQNALLKLFEEPKDNYIFVLVIPNKKELFSTLLSRFQTIENTTESKKLKDEEKFIKMTLPERLSFVEKFLKENEDNDSTRSLVGGLYDSYIKILRDSNSLDKSILENYNSLRPLVNTRGSSPKIILEFLAYTLPNI